MKSLDTFDHSHELVFAFFLLVKQLTFCLFSKLFNWERDSQIDSMKVYLDSDKSHCIKANSLKAS